jgi:hypothetical protein
MARAKFPSHDSAKWVGIGAIVLGSYALYDAYEQRGRGRPWWLKWLPGA